MRESRMPDHVGSCRSSKEFWLLLREKREVNEGF